MPDPQRNCSSKLYLAYICICTKYVSSPRIFFGGSTITNPNMRRVKIKPNFSRFSERSRSYFVRCHGRLIFTTVTCTPAVVRSWLYKVRTVYYLNRRLVVGLGVQWCDSKSEPSTLQLCVGRYCLVFQLLYADNAPASLRRFLSDPSISFVGFWNYRDGEMLRRSEHRLDVDRLIDVRNVAAERRGLPLRISMEVLADEILGIDGVDKPVEIGRSNWNVRILSHEHVTYACVDAFISFCLGRDLNVWNWTASYWNTSPREVATIGACFAVVSSETGYSSDDHRSYTDDDELALKDDYHQYHYDEQYGSYLT